MTTELKLIKLLRDEMVLALGCTEPIAIAYAAALVTKHLGHPPATLSVQCSANIIKNVKSVLVPNSGGMKGIDAACILGAYAGNAEKKLEVLSTVTSEQVKQCQQLVMQKICQVELMNTESTLHIIITGYCQQDTVTVEIADSHTHVVKITNNEQIIYTAPPRLTDTITDKAALSIDSIEEVIHFARYGNYTALIDLLDLAIASNSTIAQEGLHHNYGICVGKTILLTTDNNIRNRAKAYTAAASDARMSGCNLPVMINSGSGNQGLTASLPIIEYAKSLNCSQEKLYRSLILSNLVALFEKSYIGKLSAYCGVVCAASGSAAGITLLKEGTDEQIKAAITNTLGTLSGMICDGAKPSCASKIATCVDTAITCHEMAMHSHVLTSGDGIIKHDLNSTIAMVGRLANEGMRITDKEILNIMLED